MSAMNIDMNLFHHLFRAHPWHGVSIGAEAPGVVNAFIEIAEQQNTNLAVVAPGIAEALLATGLGLLAAIPAVIFYNKLSADSDRIIAEDVDGNSTIADTVLWITEIDESPFIFVDGFETGDTDIWSNAVGGP